MAGKDTFKGINSQAMAAMSLFLQFLKDPEFSYIHLEAPKFKDFNLVFNNGKKIICESKDRKGNFSYSQLKGVLKSIFGNKVLGRNDEILIICSNLDEKMAADVEQAQFFDRFTEREKRNNDYYKWFEKKFQDKGYSKNQISALSRVRFWKVSSQFNQESIYSLFSQLINRWLPYDDVKYLMDSILLEKIYKNSAESGTYTRKEILDEIEAHRNKVIEDSGYYDVRVADKMQQYEKLESSINNPLSASWSASQIKAISAQHDLLGFVMDRVQDKKISDLSQWDNLWQLTQIRYLGSAIFKLFQNNLSTEKNRRYVVDYLKSNLRNLSNFYRGDSYNVEAIRILSEILDTKPSKQLIDDAIDMIEIFLIPDARGRLYLSDNDNPDSWENQESCKLLEKLYGYANPVQQDRIFNLVMNAFEIIEDDGDFSHHAPRNAYFVLRKWLSDNFANRFPVFLESIVKQYDQQRYKYTGKLKDFKGWEGSGGGISYGGGYRISDRHFITYVLEPVIQDEYAKHPSKTWAMLKEDFIGKTAEVSRSKPDFLNRAAIGILIKRYSSKNESVEREAFGILREFILSKKGIPHKSELIFARLRGLDMLPQKKIKLLKIVTNKYRVPTDPFIEDIFFSLAVSGDSDAKKEIESWYKNPKYYGRSALGIESISKLNKFLDSDLKFAVKLLDLFMQSEYFLNNKADRFGVYDVAILIQEVFKRDYSEGLKIIRKLESSERLTRDQQVVYCYSLFSHRGNDHSDDPQVLKNVYHDIVVPLLSSNNYDIRNIIRRITVDHCREALVQFATRLASNHMVGEALDVIAVFVHDPHPYLPNKEPAGENVNDNQHLRIQQGEDISSITTVRGWCGWALMMCVISEAREELPRIFQLTKTLTRDSNYYVVQMACAALGRLVRFRLSRWPDATSNTLFLADDIHTALLLSKDIEETAFDLLSRASQWDPQVQKSLGKHIVSVFGSMKQLNQKDALRLVNGILALPAEIISESAGLLIYFAEFRKDDYSNWRWKTNNLYDDLSPDQYDEIIFKDLVLSVIQSLQKDNPEKCFPFVSQIEYLIREVGPNDGNTKTYLKLATKYFDITTDTYSHVVFDLVYRTIAEIMGKHSYYKKQWLTIANKCLRMEKGFFEKEKQRGNIGNVHWYSGLSHSALLEIVRKKYGDDAFLSMAETLFSFPKEVDVRETESVVNSLLELSRTSKIAETIIELLIRNKPSQYWNLKAQITTNI